MSKLQSNDEQAESKQCDELTKEVKEANHKVHLAKEAHACIALELKATKEKLCQAKRDEENAQKVLQAAIHKQTEYNLGLSNAPKIRNSQAHEKKFNTNTSMNQ